MRRLLWKEFRERWPWALGWMAAIVVTTLQGHGRAFYGDYHIDALTTTLLPGLLSVLVGANGYAAEISRSRMSFTYSRPIAWQALLTAKLLFGLSIALGMAVLAALYYRCCGPEAYRASATLPHLLAGIGLLTSLLYAGYLFGLACSVLIPGVAGGILVLVALLAFLAGALALNGSNTANVRQLGQVVALVLGTIIAVMVAGLSLTRFGIVLDVHERIKRFALRYVPILAACWLLFTVMPLHAVGYLLLRWHPTMTDVSPDGQYALVYWTKQRVFFNEVNNSDTIDWGYGEPAEVVRLADGAVMTQLPSAADPQQPIGSFSDWNWLSGHRAYYLVTEGVVNKEKHNYSFQERIIMLDAATGTQLKAPSPASWMRIPSPDGRYLLEIQPVLPPHTAVVHTADCHTTNLYFVSTTTGRTTSATIPAAVENEIWWESNSRIGYRGQREIPVTDGLGRKRTKTVYDAVAHVMDVPR